MISNKFCKTIVFVVSMGVVSAACQTNSNVSTQPGGSSARSVSIAPIQGKNVVPISVNGDLCSSQQSKFYNKPCVSVKICSETDLNNCQVINDILLDTGSYGLRIFKSAITIPLTPVSFSPKPVASPTMNSPAATNSASSTTSSYRPGTLYECAEFGDGSSLWGPVALANVVLGSESPVLVPIHVNDDSYPSTGLSTCETPYTDASSAHFNGILGVGLLAQDCGDRCLSSGNQMYFSCNLETSSSPTPTSSTGSFHPCVGASVSPVNQVQNPVAYLPVDNNGVIITLPDVPLGGVNSANGFMILGIGTQPNNSPNGVSLYSADPNNLYLSTQLHGTTYSGFLDTGSNAYFFDDPSNSDIFDCGKNYPNLAGWYCATTFASLTATNTGKVAGQSPHDVLFSIGNLALISSSSFSVFSELGASASGSPTFDWGLPFFFGRRVFVGIEGKSSSLGTGPYWAY